MTDGDTNPMDNLASLSARRWDPLNRNGACHLSLIGM